MPFIPPHTWPIAPSASKCRKATSACLKKGHFELPNSLLLLKAVCEAKRFIHRVFLENIQSSVQRYLPTGVGDDMPSMGCTGAIERPLESDAGAFADCNDGIKVFALATDASLVSVFVKAVVAWFRFRLRVWLARPWVRRSYA